jgi:antitoxin component of RelBE/YafQ-DinJ toxin-antitoxin module
MAKTETIIIRTTKSIKSKAKAIAKERELSLSELIVDYIKQLPEPKESDY